MQNHWHHTQFPSYALPQRLHVRDAIAYGWRKLAANVGVWLGIMAVAAIFMIVVYTAVVAVAITSVFGSDSTGPVVVDDALPWQAIVLVGVLGTVGYLAAAMLVRGSLLELDGHPPAFGDFWRITNARHVVLFAVVASTANAVIGGNLGSIPNAVFNITVSILVWFVLQFVLDRGMTAGAAFMANLHLLVGHPWPLSRLLITLVTINVLGMLPCGVGLLFTIPVSVIAGTYAYRVLTGGPVAV